MLLGDKKLSIEQLLELDRTLPSVPPVEAYTPMMGKITITIKMDYINFPFEKMFEFRYALWGAQEKMYFVADKSQLKVTASLELLSKYFWDMNILCIEVISTMNPSHQDPTIIMSHRSKSPSSYNFRQQKKVVGYVYISLRKYFINYIINSFSQQKYSIIDLRKNRIGEMGVQFKIDMLQNNGMKFRQIVNQDKNSIIVKHYPQRTQTKYLTINYNNKQQRLSIQDKNRFSYDELQTFQQRQKVKKVTISDRPELLSNNYNSLSQLKDSIKQSRMNEKQLVDEVYYQKNYFSHNDLNEIGLGKMVINEAPVIDENKITRRQYEMSIGKRKQLSSKIYIPDSVPQVNHSDLSLIRMKWGSNYPTVQLMKLRLDEAKYLQTQSKQSTMDSEFFGNQNSRMNFILKDITLVSAKNFTQTRGLVVSHFSGKGGKIMLKTEINLQALVKNHTQRNSIQLNHLIVLNGVYLDDKILIQTTETFVQLSIKDLLSGRILDLRRKDNKKRAFQLRYQIGFENRQIMGQEQQKRGESILYGKNKGRKDSPAKVESKQTVVGGLKTKQINKIITNGRDRKSRSKVKNLKIIPEKQNGEIAPQEIATPYNKLLIKSDIDSRKQSPQIDKRKCAISTFLYFELLYVIQDESCYQIVTKLLSEDKLQCQEQILRLGQLESLLTNKRNSDYRDIYSLIIIVDNLFRGSFEEFYKCFLSYKEINQRYQTVLYKLKKVLVSTLSDSKQLKREHPHLNKIVGILDYVKKHKKDKLTFGLVKYQDLLQIIKDKLQPEIEQMTFSPKLLREHEKIQTEKSSLTVVERKKQQHSNNSLKVSNNYEIINYIDALLVMFIRYERDHIKLSEVQNNLNQFIKSRVSPQLEEIIELNINLGFLFNLHRQVELKDLQKSHQKYTDCYLYHFIQECKEILALNLNEKQEHEMERMSVYSLLFEDPLNLQELKSSIHYSLYDRLQGRDQKFITEQQDIHNQRFKTESERVSYYKDKRSQQIKGKQLKTQQLMSNIELNSLNTQDERIIDLINLKKENNRAQINFNLSINNNNTLQAIRRRQEDQVVGIQITKKDQFFQIEVPNSKSNIQNQEQNHRMEDGFLHQHQEVHNKVQTKYVAIKCSLINPQQFGQNRRFKDEGMNQVVNLFYCHYKIDGGSQQFKIQAREVGNIVKLLPNSFKIIESQKTPVQEYTFRVQASSLKTKRAQVLRKQTQTILKVKNIMGRQRYPVQDSQGKIWLIMDIQIQEVDEFEQKVFEEEQEKMIEQQKSKEKCEQNFNQIFILNINKLFCLNLFEITSCLRVIYQAQNQIQLLKDVDLFDSNQSNKTVGTRVIPMNVDFIKLKGLKGPAQRHLIKIFNVKKWQSKKIANKPTVNRDKNQINKLKARFSQPVSRFLDDQEQDSCADLKNEALDLVCQFQFTLNPNMSMQKCFGVRKQSIWLTDGPFRLQIDLFDARYQKWSQQNDDPIERKQSNIQKQNIWQKKIEKILSVFKIQNQQKFQQEFYQYKNNRHQPNEITFGQFMRLIAFIMGYRLTEKQILTSLCFPLKDFQLELEDHKKLQYMCYLLNINKGNEGIKEQKKKELQIKHLSALYEEFETFDLEHEGFLSHVKFQVIKRILPELKQLPIQIFTLHSSKDRQNHLINDCKISQKQNKKSIIDYLKILWENRKYYEQDFFFEKRVLNQNRKGLDADKKVEVEVKKADEKKLLSVEQRVDEQANVMRGQQSQVEQFNQEIIPYARKQQKPLTKAFDGSASKKLRYDIEQMLRLERDESLLSQTRKEWQNMISKNIGQNQQLSIQQMLKKEIDEEELQRKFELFKGDGFSDSSDSEIQSD